MCPLFGCTCKYNIYMDRASPREFLCAFRPPVLFLSRDLATPFHMYTNKLETEKLILQRMRASSTELGSQLGNQLFHGLYSTALSKYTTTLILCAIPAIPSIIFSPGRTSLYQFRFAFCPHASLTTILATLPPWPRSTFSVVHVANLCFTRFRRSHHAYLIIFLSD